MEPSDQARVEALLTRLGELNGRIAVLYATRDVSQTHAYKAAIEETYRLSQKEITHHGQSNEGKYRTACPFVGL